MLIIQPFPLPGYTFHRGPDRLTGSVSRTSSEQYMTHVGYLGINTPRSEADSRKGKRVNQPPFFNKAKVQPTVRKFQQSFADKWDDTITQSGDSYGTQIPDQQGAPRALRPVTTINSWFP